MRSNAQQRTAQQRTAQLSPETATCSNAQQRAAQHSAAYVWTALNQLDITYTDKLIFWLLIFRSHRIHSVHNMRSLLQTEYRGLCVCWSHLGAQQKRLNPSRCCLGAVSGRMNHVVDEDQYPPVSSSLAPTLSSLAQDHWTHWIQAPLTYLQSSHNYPTSIPS